MTAAVTPGELLACPFCNEHNTEFTCAEEKDERRYVQMLLECHCGARMSEALSWNLYSKMSERHIDAHLRSALTKRWNTRLAAKPSDEWRDGLAVACLRRLARTNINNLTQRALAGSDIVSTLEKIDALSTTQEPRP